MVYCKILYGMFYETENTRKFYFISFREMEALAKFSFVFLLEIENMQGSGEIRI
jgi:hypothetical protein